jgi:hypothetical protein
MTSRGERIHLSIAISAGLWEGKTADAGCGGCKPAANSRYTSTPHHNALALLNPEF